MPTPLEVFEDNIADAERLVGIERPHVELALSRVPLRRMRDVPEKCWSRSYIFAILSDPRVRDGEW